MNKLNEPWYKLWFESPYYSLLYSHRDEEDAERLVKLIVNNVNNLDHKVILDLACGNGRHTKILNNYYENIISLDLSSTLLKNAKENLKKIINHTPLLIRADYGHIPIKKKSINLVLSLFTSFGYFETDLDHEILLKNWSELLEENGSLVLDLPNLNYVKNNLKNKTIKELSDTTITEERIITEVPYRVIKKIVISGSNKKEEYTESVRLFSYNEILELTKKLNLKVSRCYGSYLGDEYIENSSSRMVLFLKK